jgi:hypothetical protein
MSDAQPGPDYVLRALAAAEIAESTFEPRLRASFFELSETWLTLAGEEPEDDERPVS